jgi:hypothetical protein
MSVPQRLDLAIPVFTLQLVFLLSSPFLGYYPRSKLKQCMAIVNESKSPNPLLKHEICFASRWTCLMPFLSYV